MHIVAYLPIAVCGAAAGPATRLVSFPNNIFIGAT